MMSIKLTESFRQTVTGVLHLSISKQRRLRTVLTLMVAMVAGLVFADSYTYVCNPPNGTYTETGSNTTTTSSITINYSSNTHSTSPTTNYTNGTIKATVYGHDSNGDITFRIIKADNTSYFLKNTTGKVYVWEVGRDKLYYKQFTISNSTTDHIDITASVGNFSGTRIFRIFMIKSDGLKYYGGQITITGTGIFPPTATTKEAKNIDQTSATLKGNVSANGAKTTLYFKYGTSSSNLNKATSSQTIGANEHSDYTAKVTNLSSGTLYYFRVYASNSEGSDEGDILSFKTVEADNNPPAAPSNPSPSDGATNVSTSAKLTWSCSDPDGDALTYYVYFGTSTSDWKTNTTSSKSYTPTLSAGKTYVWMVKASDGTNIKSGPTWTFSTASNSSGGDAELEQAVTYLSGRNIIDGSTVSAAKTSDPLLRQHLAKMAFYGAYGSESAVPSTVPSDNYPSVYDLDVSTYYYRAVKALLYMEYGDGVTPFDRNRLTFDPTEEMPRIYVLKALMEAFNQQPDMSNTSLSFTDLSSLDTQLRLKGYLRKAVSLGIVNTSLTTWRPSAICTRGEAILMLYRLMNKVGIPKPGDTDYFEPLNTTMKTISMSPGLQMGNFQHYTKTSFAIGGTVPLTFAHAYNSYNTTLPEVFYGANDDGETYQPLGDGWSHNYHSYVTIVGKIADKTARAVVHWGGGSFDVYKSDGSNLVPESFGVYDEMSVVDGGAEIKTKSQMTYRFTTKSSGGPNVLYLTSIVDRNGNTLTINYATGENNAKRISSVSDGNGRSLTFSYGQSGTNLLTAVSDPLGRSIKFSYTFNSKTQRYQLTSFTDAKNQKTIYEYGDNTKVSTSKLLEKIQLPKGNYIENEYDANRRLNRTVSGVDGVPTTETAVTVNANYNSGVSTMSRVDVTRNGSNTASYNYTFNANNSMTKMTGEEGLSVSRTYGNSSLPELPTAIQSNNTNISNITYDAKGNITKIVVSGDGTLTTTMTYDDMNNLTSVTDPKGYKTTYSYDSNGNLTGVSAPEGVSTSITVNSKGLPTEISDPMGVKTQFTYNSYGNLTKTTLPALSLSSSAAYDKASRLTSSTDALGHTTTFSYDNNDNLTSQTDADSHTTSFDYDKNDNLTSITNAKGGVTSMSYDNATDWLTSVSFAGATKRYSYNDDGTLDTYTKPDGTRLSYEYDDLGRVTSDGVNTYSYDSKLRLQSVSGNGKTVSFTYDGFNRITGTSCNGHSNSYSYDKNGNCTSINNTTYGYDKLDRLTSVTFSGKTINYTYRKDSRLSEVTYPNGMTTTFGYDAVGRLTSKKTALSNGTVVASYSYTLDKVGNITKQTTNEPYGDMVLTNEDVSYSYNSGNRITKAGDISFSFDENGNTTKRGSESYSWDDLDRLTRAGSTNITYDPLGLIASYGDITFTTDPLGMGNVLSDTKSGATYIYGNGLEARVVGSKVSYYVTDFRGSVVAIVDKSGNITHKYQYDEFGKVTQKEEPAGDANYNPFQYVGKYGVMYLTDHLYYMRARHYDPTIGRFLSEDPIWSTNLYPYAENNPIMGIDPKGLYLEISYGNITGYMHNKGEYGSDIIVFVDKKGNISTFNTRGDNAKNLQGNYRKIYDDLMFIKNNKYKSDGDYIYNSAGDRIKNPRWNNYLTTKQRNALRNNANGKSSLTHNNAIDERFVHVPSNNSVKDDEWGEPMIKQGEAISNGSIQEAINYGNPLGQN